MKGLLDTSTVTNNEEYKGFIKGKMKGFVILAIIGAITLTIGLLAEFVWKIQGMDRTLGIYTGVGTGLFGAGVALWIKNFRLLKQSEEKIKEDRLKRFDERIAAISSKAFRMATVVMVAAMYVFCLVGAFWYPQLVNILLLFVCVLLLAYTFFYFYYNKKM